MIGRRVSETIHISTVSGVGPSSIQSKMHATVVHFHFRWNVTSDLQFSFVFIFPCRISGVPWQPGVPRA